MMIFYVSTFVLKHAPGIDAIVGLTWLPVMVIIGIARDIIGIAREWRSASSAKTGVKSEGT